MNLSVLIAAALTLAAVKERYAAHDGIEADIVQTKESPYLVKPLVSKVHLSVKGATVRWEVQEPVASTVIFDERGARIAGEAGSLPDGPKTTALLSFLKALAAVDFPALERDFVLTVVGERLIATPRPESQLGMIKELALEFDAALNIRHLTVTADNEITKLAFTKLELAPRKTKP